MKALSITEPYASLIADGVKHIETRSWKTNYRGPLLIHASSTPVPKAYRENDKLMALVQNVRRGYILCRADLVDCVEMTDEFLKTVDETEQAAGFYSVGRYAWILDNVEPVPQVKARGSLGLWNVV